ncbi:site-specific integrase [Lysinibacillus sphaericus]|uniref:Integrase n=3 Tax=Lysinibacillus TaxID=400634 RepID=W7S2R1_LYSSH|nr:MULTISPECIES: site-specific integrase [Lysinibacillus]MBE5084372.1 site-specific integrase [Bacillus thuringiensis]ACA38107.1 prophage Lp3 protein 1, integrase [Lysinibacillus sphaericus C3-41]AMO32277.1 integrase [Lysinibacillus sphaericus]AMR92624.1 integrase [Lysinibacillus sphaericus]ANA46673.1 integrase [Lysinibacillus sphaericus]
MAKKKVSPIKSYELKNGETRYEFPVYLGIDPLTGKQKRTMKRGFKTHKQAELALARIKLDVANGTYKQARAETYQELYDLWIPHYEKTVEESTFTKTVGIFRNHILPAMREYKIDKITVDVCQKHVDKWAEKLKKFRVVKAYAAKVLDFAIKRGYMQTNPFTHVDMPIAASKKVTIIEEEEAENFYTREQLIQFLACLEQENNYKAYALFRLLAFSGMRKGEALALTWNDLNFTTNEMRINKALSRGKNNKLYVKSTKTGFARTIKMDDKTMAILKEWKKKQKQEYLVLGFNTMQPKQLVFSNERNEFLQPTKTRKWILHVQKKYKLGTITTHGLRHTHCSLLFEAGASLKEVQDRLGHSDVQTTMNIYAHVTKKAKEEAIQKFASYLEM